MDIEKEIREYSEEHKMTCKDCGWYNDAYETEVGSKLSYCLKDLKILLFSDRNWHRENIDNLFNCFSPKDNKLKKLLYYRSILLKQYKNEKKIYLKNGVKWKPTMIDKVKIKRRNNELYPYSIVYMGREEVLMTDEELIELYNQITDIIVDNEKLIQ